MSYTSAWIPAASVVIAGIVRVCKTDAWVSWCPVNLAPKVRPWLAVGLGAASGAVAYGMGGGAQAVAGGFFAGFGAIASHDLVVESIRRGRDIGVPKEPDIEIVGPDTKP